MPGKAAAALADPGPRACLPLEPASGASPLPTPTANRRPVGCAQGRAALRIPAQRASPLGTRWPDECISFAFVAMVVRLTRKRNEGRSPFRNVGVVCSTAVLFATLPSTEPLHPPNGLGSPKRTLSAAPARRFRMTYNFPSICRGRNCRQSPKTILIGEPFCPFIYRAPMIEFLPAAAATDESTVINNKNSTAFLQTALNSPSHAFFPHASTARS